MRFPVTTRTKVLDTYNKKIEDLDISVRSSNCFYSASLYFVAELAMMTEAEVLKIKHFGRKSFNEMRELLNELGLRFGCLTVVATLREPVITLGLSDATLEALKRSHHMSIMALVLWTRKELGLSEEQEREVNKALKPLDLQLYMSIYDLFVDAGMGLTEEQMTFLGQDISALGLPQNVAEEFTEVDHGCWIGMAMLMANLPGYKHHAVFNECLMAHGLTLGVPIFARDFFRLRLP